MHPENDQPSRKKPFFPVSKDLHAYLKTHGREVSLPISYKNLLNITYSVPLTDKKGKDTLWEKALYDMKEWEYLKEGLINLYAIIKNGGRLYIHQAPGRCADRLLCLRQFKSLPDPHRKQV